MRFDNFSMGRGLVLAAVALCMGAAMAEKPEWAGQQGGPGKKNEAQREDRRDAPRAERSGERQREEVRRGEYFRDEHRAVIREHYDRQYGAAKHCPPGLAKKHNGCMPPGQAKKWAVGRPLPREVIYYPVPPAVVVQLGVPPAGHKFVRVAGDILLIAIGTGMVIDAIEDLGRK